MKAIDPALVAKAERVLADRRITADHRHICVRADICPDCGGLLTEAGSTKGMILIVTLKACAACGARFSRLLMAGEQWRPVEAPKHRDDLKDMRYFWFRGRFLVWLGATFPWLHIRRRREGHG